MPEIFLNNVELIDKLRELYSNASPSKIRDLIASHFIRSEVSELVCYRSSPEPV